MRTQLDYAKAGIVTEEMKQAVVGESISAEQLRDLIGEGVAVLPKNIRRSFPTIRAIGRNLKTKVNANLGTSGECASQELERAKLKASLDAQTDSIMTCLPEATCPSFVTSSSSTRPSWWEPCPFIPWPRKRWPNTEPLETMDSDQLLRRH